MYESPFSVSFMEEIAEEVAKEVGEWIDDSTMKATVDAKITVDKDELVKALAYDRGQYDKGYADGYQDGKRDAWEWISTYERLPDVNKRVLACASILGKPFVWDAVRWNGEEWETEKEAAYEYWTPIDFPVTHWMPLPEPPKEESDG